MSRLPSYEYVCRMTFQTLFVRDSRFCCFSSVTAIQSTMQVFVALLVLSTQNLPKAAIAAAEKPVSGDSEVEGKVPSDVSPQSGVVRRDPSDVIRVNGNYYVYYSKMVRAIEDKRAKKLRIPLNYPAGYHADVFGAVSDDEGHTWKELGPMVIRGEQGNWDSNSVFTPNILCHKNRYYLYFTAVGTSFTNQGYTDFNRTSIGLAIADDPAGPFEKLDKPILESTKDKTRFDSFRVDDSAIRVVDGKIWLYYKGRQWTDTPQNTKMGLAIAEHPVGTYVRANDGKPIQNSGHEVLVWEHDESVYSYVAHGHGPNSGTVRRVPGASSSTQSFDDKAAIVGPAPRLRAPGLYRPELTGHPLPKDSTRWGIQMRRHGGTHISLERFTFDMKTWLPR